MIEDFAALGVLLTIAGFFAYTQAPRHWQGLGGFLLITFGWLPVAILGICIVKQPVLLVPAVFVLGVFTASRRRA
jgi:hypothetical protein